VPLPAATVQHYDAVQRIAAVALAGLASAWGRMGPDFDATYAGIAPGLVALTRAAKTAAAASGARSIAPALAEQDIARRAVVDVVPAQWSRYTADGRTIEGLLDIGVITAKRAAERGFPPGLSLAAAQDRLAAAIQTEISDAGRSAAMAQMVATPRTGWTRVVNPPCCGRCAVLAGRFYPWSSGFARHPRCDCTMTPSTEGDARAVVTTPQSLYEAMSEADRCKAFTVAGARAIADGADIGAVVNARRGMTVVGSSVSADGLVVRRGRVTSGAATTERATRGQPRRLTPEGIYARAGADRDEAVRLLVANGYAR